jgi:hypothetical protein
MLRTLAILTATLALGGSALAAERAQVPCKALAKLKTEADAKTHFATLTIGQYHFAAGLYVASPSTPAGMPPGDGAILVTHDGDKNGMIVWMRGPLACGPIQVDDRLIKMLTGVRTGAGEDGSDL